MPVGFVMVLVCFSFCGVAAFCPGSGVERSLPSHFAEALFRLWKTPLEFLFKSFAVYSSRGGCWFSGHIVCAGFLGSPVHSPIPCSLAAEVVWTNLHRILAATRVHYDWFVDGVVFVAAIAGFPAAFARNYFLKAFLLQPLMA